ncbi:hypothetical protein [Streptomyces nanshensis]|uniref:Aromatic ring-opening dioxygenase LigA n=1 Tax=Streptomyces nanshensis TaxID=518642 RepID=A0A1E7KWY4_9ACTN|nr:hypothetical protein [Streptomyces nanshensis]OEV08343.1 hypothetical protein AN218_26725 [Streptomyces nanshensis]
MPPTKLIRISVAAVGAGAALAVAVGGLPAYGADGDGWQSVGKGKTEGVSGISVAADGSGSGAGSAAESVSAVFVRDNKEDGENRISSVTYRDGEDPDVQPLEWKGEQPVDLEALDNVPGEQGGYLAAESSGKAYHLRVSGGTAEVVDSFTLPEVESGAEIEDLTLAAPGGDGKLVAVWGDRGEDDTPGTLYAAPLTLDADGKGTFGDVESGEVEAPYPDDDVRHASDADLTDSGALLVSSASDPGDDGPFDSAVYTAAHVTLDGSGAVGLSVEKDPEVLEKFKKHKVEAIDCLPGSDEAVLGTDDEKDGGSLTTVGGLCAD